MLLIQKGKPTKKSCAKCHRVNVEMRGRSTWCEGCRDEALAIILSNYQEQINAGIQPNQRSVMVPLDFRVFDDRFCEKLRKSITAMDRPARRLVAV